MAVRKRAAKKKAAVRGRGARVAAEVAKVERELPETLREFSARVRKRLGQLERAAVRAQERYQREAVRVLRVASHRLGRFEAEGERRWKKLTATARRDALQVLRKMEKALGNMEKALEGKAARGHKPARKAGRRASSLRAGAEGVIAAAQL